MVGIVRKLARSSGSCVSFSHAYYYYLGNVSVRQLHASSCSLKNEDDLGLNHLEFQKWHNGGGIFHKSACIDPTTRIEFGAVVHSKSVLHQNVYIGSGTIVGPSVIIGQSTKIGYNVALSNCTMGGFCVVHSGVCIGQDGFGFFVDEHGNMTKKPQGSAMWDLQIVVLQGPMSEDVKDLIIHSLASMGDSYPHPSHPTTEKSSSKTVRLFQLNESDYPKNLYARIGNHVEIGANTCVDRGSWRDTLIGDHTKIDNLVQIGHNVVIGKSCMLCGQVGLAGSVMLGDYVVLGGRVAVRDHVSIASKVRLTANSCVTKDIKESGDYGGFPAVPVMEWRRQVAALRQTLKKEVMEEDIVTVDD